LNAPQAIPANLNSRHSLAAMSNLAGDSIGNCGEHTCQKWAVTVSMWLKIAPSSKHGQPLCSAASASTSWDWQVVAVFQ